MAPGAPVSPQLRGETAIVLRSDLLALLCETSDRRACLVVAPAGCGKTTTVRQWLASRSDLPRVWLNAGDICRDPRRFVSILKRSSSFLIPSAGPDLVSAVQGDPRDQQSLSQSVADALLKIGRELKRDWILVLDDVQRVSDPALVAGLDQALEMGIPGLSVFLLGRVIPSLSSIPSLRMQGGVLDIDERALHFSPDEIKVYLRHRCGRTLSDADLKVVHERTDGWIAALSLLAQSWNRTPEYDLKRIVSALGANNNQVFDFLSSQVLADLEDDLREFLLRSSILPFLTPELCNRALTMDRAASMMDSVTRRRLFVRPSSEAADGMEYSLLFREFLRTALQRERGSGEVRELSRLSARALWECGYSSSAAEYALDAGDWATSAAIIIGSAKTMLDDGEFHQVGAWIERLPSDVLNGNAELLVALGRVRDMQGRTIEALDLLTKAESAVSPENLTHLRDLARNFKAWVYLQEGRHDLVSDVCQEVLASASGPGSASVRAGCHMVWGVSLSETGDLTRSEELLQQALDLYRSCGDRLGQARSAHALAANVYLQQGRLTEAEELDLLSLRLAEDIGPYHVCTPLITLTYYSRIRADYEKARSYVQRLLYLSDAMHDSARRAYGLTALGYLELAQGNLHEARSYLEEASVIGMDVQRSTLLAEPRLGLAMLALAEGNTPEARRQAMEALSNERRVMYPYHKLQALLVLAEIHTAEGRIDAALAKVDEALPLAQSIGNHYMEVIARLVSANLFWRDAQDANAFDALTEALIVSRQHGLDYLFLHRHKVLSSKLLPTYVVSNGSEVAEAERLILGIGSECVPALVDAIQRESGPQADRAVNLLAQVGDESCIAVLRALHRDRARAPVVKRAIEQLSTRPAAALRVYALGGFRAYRGDMPIPQEAWQRRKTRLLLLYLLRRSPRRASRDEIIQDLWPDLEPDSAILSLNTTYSDLRRILEPHLGRRMPSRYLGHDGASYWFEESAGWSDPRALEQAASVGRPKLHELLMLYQGDFLPEEPYLDWVERQRDRLRRIYVGAMEKALRETMASSAWTETAFAARHLVTVEPTNEVAVESLVVALAKTGRVAEARHVFAEYRAVLQSERLGRPSRHLVEALAPYLSSESH